MTTDNVLPDYDLSALLQLIERQSATIDDAMSRLTSYEKVIDDQRVLIGQYQGIIDNQTKRLNDCTRDHASFYRPSRAQQLQELTPINDWIN